MTAATADRAYLVAGHSVPVRSCNLPQRLQHRSQRPRPRLQPLTAPTAPVEAGVSAHGVDLVTAATADRAYLVAGHSVPVRSCNLSQRPQHRLKPVSAPTESTWTAATAGIGRTRLPVTASKPVTSAAATSHSPTAPVTASKPVSAPTESTW